MIRFEEHDGMLFKMLEEPTPLTPDAEMPCLVRLIQDDSPMGKHNKDLHGFDPERLTPRICTEVIDVNDLSDPNRGSARCDGLMSIQYYRYELIGTHVKEGSDDWAWYQMMQGEKIIGTFHKPLRFYAIKKGCDYCALYENDGNEVRINTRRTYGEFIEYSKRCRISSWKIYKEPESQYKVGDWVELNVYNNHQGQVKKVFPAGMGGLCGTRIHRTEPTFLITGLSGEFHYDTITRILSPAEVVIHIGCLSGTVRPVSTNGIHVCFRLIGVDDKTIATIRISCLDAPTREIVESLLKAQEEGE